MGEHQTKNLNNSDEATTKIAIVSVATFLETCAKSLSEIARTGIGPAGATHLQSIGGMVAQCALSLRSYSASYKSTDYSSLLLDPELPQKVADEFGLSDDGYLEEEQEFELARLLGTLPPQEDGTHGSSNENAPATALP